MDAVPAERTQPSMPRANSYRMRRITPVDVIRGIGETYEGRKRRYERSILHGLAMESSMQLARIAASSPRASRGVPDTDQPGRNALSDAYGMVYPCHRSIEKSRSTISIVRRSCPQVPTDAISGAASARTAKSPRSSLPHSGPPTVARLRPKAIDWRGLYLNGKPSCGSNTSGRGKSSHRGLANVLYPRLCEPDHRKNAAIIVAKNITSSPSAGFLPHCVAVISRTCSAPSKRPPDDAMWN